ncbi:hypothetical protein RB653_008619 [Dictyostelium firmibasis]|uniref:Calponin-homology (CH) domain-containing protein n=1 Tax=Dictyostelium firmibasis TaxID=79012 RepID=A0AAN7YPG3_9MYCE
MIETSFLKWINSFQDLSSPIEDLKELSNGTIFNEICCQIAPKYFDIDSLRKDGLDNWIFREENIKNIVERVDEFYKEEMGLSDQTLSINCEEIANENVDEIILLIEAILGMAMESENNESVIENILSLDQDTQNDLMLVVAKIQESHKTNTVDNSKSFDKDESNLSQSPSQNSSNIDGNNNINKNSSNNNNNNSNNNSSREEIINLQNEIERIKREKQDIQNDLDESNIQLSNVTMDRDRITQDKQKTEEVCSSLHESIIGLQKQLDETMAQTTTMNALNDETYKTEINDLHMQVESKEKQLSELKKKVDEANRLANENRSLRDEIDILREKAANAEATEEKLKKHQKKIEEIGDLKKKIKELEDQNDSYIQQTLDLEEQLSKNNTYRTQADSSKQQVSSLKIELAKLELSLKSAKEDRDKLTESLSTVELERDSLQSQVTNLRSTIDNQQQDYETKFIDLQSSISLNSGGGGGLGDEVVDGSTKERIARLERDNKRLKEFAEKASELENQLEDANQSKELMTIQIKQLEEQKQQSTSNNSNNMVDSSELEALKQQLKEKEKEISTLKRKLEESNLSLDENRKQLVELSQRPTTQSPGDIEKLENYDNLLKENDGLEGRLRAARNIIKDLREKHKSYSNQETQLATKDEVISKLESLVKKKTDINEDLRKQLEEGREESQREISLMLSAFLKIGLEMEQVKIQNISKEPRSFLNKKRGD